MRNEMKKTVWVALGIFCMAVSLSSAVLVDDFQGYALGDVDVVTVGTWVESPTNATTTFNIAADPTNAANQVLSVQNNGAQIGVYGLLTGDAIIANNTTKTLSLQFYVTNPVGYDTSFGLTSADTPNQFGNFLVQCALINGTFRARNGGALGTATAPITANTWYSLWVVVDNTANTSTIYLKSTAADATAGDLFAGNYAFRTIGSLNPDGDLDRFFAFTNFGSSGGVTYSSTAILFDNINIRDGVNLTYIMFPAAFQAAQVGYTLVV